MTDYNAFITVVQQFDILDIVKGAELHLLKSFNPDFQNIKSGFKTFEFRYNDRFYKRGDYILLNEYGEITKEYTGRICLVKITHIENHINNVKIPEDWVIMSIFKKYD